MLADFTLRNLRAYFQDQTQLKVHYPDSMGLGGLCQLYFYNYYAEVCDIRMLAVLMLPFVVSSNPSRDGCDPERPGRAWPRRYLHPISCLNL